jgi:hypothetical protein
MRRRPAPSSGIHLRIGRIVVDSAALGDASREQLHGDIGAALSQYLSGDVAKGPPTLAQHIAESVAPQVHAQLPSKGGRDGAL